MSDSQTGHKYPTRSKSKRGSLETTRALNRLVEVTASSLLQQLDEEFLQNVHDRQLGSDEENYIAQDDWDLSGNVEVQQQEDNIQVDPGWSLLRPSDGGSRSGLKTPFSVYACVQSSSSDADEDGDEEGTRHTAKYK